MKNIFVKKEKKASLTNKDASAVVANSAVQDKNTLVKILLTTLIIFFIANIIISPAKYIKEGLNGISAWAFNVLPSVLPFMFFTKALSSLGQMEKLTRPFQGVTKTLFNTPPISLYTFLMAILSGYPVGSKMIADLYLQGKINKEEAFRMSAFCSTSGPMFIVGAVGASMFKSASIGYILFLSHILSAFLNGLIYRKIGTKNLENSKNVRNHLKKGKKSEKKRKKVTFLSIWNKNFLKSGNSKKKEKEQTAHKSEQNAALKSENIEENSLQKSSDIALKVELKNAEKKKENNNADLSEIVLSSTLAIMSVGCIITIFFIIIECLSPIFSLFPENISAFLEGVVEITKGCLSLSELANVKLAMVLASFVVSFGGTSTLLQSLTMLQQVKMPVKLFALQKFTHALLSALISTIMVLVLM